MFLRFQFHSFCLSSTLINVSNRMKQFRKVINLSYSYNEYDISTDVTINKNLRSCIELKDLKRGLEITQNLSTQSMKNPLIQLNLIRLYIKCGDLNRAQEIFDDVNTKKTSTMYYLMIKGLADNDQSKEALKLFQQMTIPVNDSILTIIFKICSKIGDDESLQFGKSVLKTLPVIYRNHKTILTSALHMFMQNGDISSGENLFDKMQKDLIVYGTMMSGYLKSNQPKKAVEIFLKIKEPDEIIFMLFFNACTQMKNEQALKLGKQTLSQFFNKYNRKNMKSKALYAAFDMFIKYDDRKSAEILFTQLNRDIVCYGSLMKFYHKKNEPEKILDLIEQMKRDKIEPNDIILVFIINACSQIGDLSKCDSIISQIPNGCLNSVRIKNALINMWGKAGSVEEAKHVFEMIQKPDVITFGAMINSYGLNGMGTHAVELFRQMPIEILNESIYVSVLNACSHSGLIQEAREIFNKIPITQKTNKIYTTMIDAFSRSYLINEAEELLIEFEKNHLPDVIMYMTILSAARNQRNTSLAQNIFNRIKFRFPNDKDYVISSAILLANTYALNNDLSMAFNIRMKLSQSGMKKLVGISSTVINGKIIKFRAHDRSHGNLEEFDAEADQLMTELIQHGYKCDSSWITRPMVDDDTAESLLCGHSERLAILFNLIQRPVPTRIQITKNLRVCGDCHEVTKLIARIRQCNIIVRDANRIHHFYPNGQCSCQDHF